MVRIIFVFESDKIRSILLNDFISIFALQIKSLSNINCFSTGIMKEEATGYFLILLIVYVILGLILFAYSVFRNRKEINFLSASFILRALLYLAPSLFATSINLEFSAWITGPIKVFIIPLSYFFVRSLFGSVKLWRSRDMWHFVPFIFDCILTFAIASGHASEVVNGNQIGIKEVLGGVWEENFYFTLLSTVARTISLVQCAFYFILTIPLVRKCIALQKQEKSQINYSYFRWLKGIVFLFIIMGFFEGLGIFGVYVYPPVFLSMFLFLVFYAFYMFLFVLLFSEELNGLMEKAEEYIFEEQIEDPRSLVWLKEFVEKEMYLDPALTLQKTAHLLNVPKYKLTQWVRDEGYPSFYTFVNTYRVEKNKALLLEIPDSFVLESVIADSGFNSRSTYFRVFKEIAGETPRSFVENYKIN
jgi:AraC-like DNA-binding protein